MTPVRVFLAEDHLMVREGLKRLIGVESDMSVIGEATNGRDAVRDVLLLRPDVVVMDLSLPIVSGLEATRQIKRAQAEIKVVVLTVHEDQGYVQESLIAGAEGYVLKRAVADELLAALRATKHGGRYIDSRVRWAIVPKPKDDPTVLTGPLAALKHGEAAVLRLLALGYSNKEIGVKLGLSVKTVETYKSHGMETLGLKNRVELVRFAVACGWFPG